MAQKVETTIRFNSTTSEYEVYGKPDFSAAVFNVGGGTQITVVLPKSIADAKLTITSVNGGVWADNSTVYAPTAAPNSDFHGISTTGAPMSWTTGQEKMLFKFSLTGNCVAGVRLFENTSDPQSDAPGMLFGDYNNYIGNAINFADVYKSNYDNTGTTCSVNLPPIATNDIGETPQDKPFIGNVLTNDNDPEGGSLMVTTTPVTPPTKGTVSLNPDGTFTYTPNPGVTGQDGFCYEVKDNVGLKDTACVVINIIPTPTPGNDKPIAVDDNTQTEVGTPVTINAKANDSDPDASGTPNGTLGTPVKLTNPTNGTVSQNPDGTFVYTPNANFTGTDKFTYRICDNGTPSLCDTATVTINVVPVIAGNNPPVAVDDANVTTRNTPVSGTVASNDSDVDNTAAQLTYAKVTNPTNGTVVQNADGTYTYTPTTGFVGSDRYTYKVCDPSGACDTATVVIAILPPANQPPIATNDIAETPQDKPFTGNVLTNDDDPEGGPLTVTTTPVTPPTKGTVSLNPDGTFTYTPNPGVTGQDGFCYEVKDNVGLKDTACVVINIIPTPTPGNDKPIAVDDNTQTEVGTPVTINAKANDSDPDASGTPNGTLGTPAKLTNPTNGTVSQNPDGTFVYTPNANFTGTDKFTYRICDNGTPSLCDTATVSINVVPVIAGNNPPVAVDDANVTTKNTPVSGTVAANDSDPDNTAAQLTYTKVTNPTNGTVVQNADGTYTYTPNTNYVGSDSYTYKVCDPSGACDTATVVVAILPPANQPPIATNDIAETPQDKPFTGNVLTNDDDPEGGPLTVTTTPVTPPTKGTVSLNPDGTFTYTPNPGVTGQDGFCYEVKDNAGLKDTACVVINIIPTPTPGNDKPIAVDDNTQTEVGTPVTINAKANDSDPDASGTPNGTLGTPSKLTNPTNGTVSQNPDGTFVYTPNANFTGTDKFTYRICDNGTPSLCDTATVSINVVPVIAGNNPPVAVDDANVTTRNTPVSGTVAANDSDVDNTAAQLTYTKVTNPTNGTVVQNADGTYTYTPTTGFVGSDRYTYKVCDPSGACDTATVVIAILPPTNNPPIATNDIAETPQDKPFTGNVLTNDDDPEGGPLTVTTTPVTPPTKGTVSLNPDGTFTYTPNPGVTGQDGFCYEVKDNVGLKDTACVVINIIPTPTPGNDKPIAVDDNTQTEVGTPVTINAKANDSDPDVSGTPNGTLGTPAKLTNPTNGTVTQNPDGTFVYTPNANFTGTDKFTYRICDNGTPNLCDTATVTINVVPVIAGNNPPVAVDDANVTTRNTPVSGTVAANDSDPDNTAAQLTYAKVTNPTNGTVVQNADGTYTYTPNTNYVGSDRYTYKVCDPSGACDTATVVIAILPPANNPPIATNDIGETPQDKPFTGNVLTNDDDPEGGPLTVTTTPVTPPTKGTVSLNPDGTFTYTPNPGVTGQDGFCYEVKDNVGLKDTACVVINIIPTPTPGNDKPIAVDDNTQTEVGTPVTINAKANDSDPDGNATLGTPVKLTNPTNGTVSQNPDGTFVYTPNANFTGTDKFTYRICDNGTPSLCDTATVTINVVPVIAGNNPPVAVDDANVTTRNTPVSGTVAANDSDVDNTAAQLTYTKVTNPTNGTVVQNADGTYTYTPNTNYVGSDRYTYKVCDPSGACDTATVVIAILPPANNPPIATNDIGETPQDKPFTGNVLTNDDDPEGGPLTVTTTPVTPPTKGTVSLNPDGTFTYTPNPGVTGQDGFCYEVKDNVGLKDTACVVINIIPTPTPGNDKPIAVDDNTQTEVGTPVTINAKANDSDPDGNATLGTPVKLTNPTNGTVTQNPDGTFVYTPNANFTGTDKFTYRICDNGTPSLCDTATVTINVVPVIAGNNPPVAVDDANVTTKNTPVSGTVAANDSDVDNTAAQLVYTRVTNPTNGTVVQNADGTYTYTPTTGFVGSDRYTYKVCDPSGACDTATVVIAILPPANNPPIATNDIGETPQDKPFTGNVLTNDNDPEGGPLTVTTTPVTPPTKGTVSLNPDGTFTYTPNPGVTGQDGFCYEVKDNVGLKDTACVVINIIPTPTPGNDKPIAVDDNTQTEVGTPVTINAKANDSDPDGNATLGTPVKLTNPTNGTVSQNPDGTFVYTPNANFTGTDKFTYRICDNGTPSLCDTATVTINVVPVIAGNNPPVAVDDANVTTKNTPVSGTVAANDSDVDNTAAQLTYAKVTNPTNGTVVQNADGTYTYTPNTNYVGSDSYTYKVCDPSGACDTATVVIAILPPANQPPIATNDIAETPQDKPFTGNVLTNDDDPEGGPLTVTTTPVTPPTKGTVSLNPDGTFTYTPNPGVTGQDGFCYEVKDNVGLKDTACVVINIIPTPTPGNDKPIAVDDNTQTEVGTPVTINAKANDSDPDGNATLGTPVKLTNPTNGTVSQNPDGTFVYTPNANFTGTDKFTYRICDNGTPSLCDTATVTINVVPVIAGNNPPVAVDDANVTTRNTPVSGTVAANDSDVDNTAAQLTYTKVTNPTNGTVVQNADGTYTYTPTTGFVGSDRYTYKVCDPSGACDTATVVIAILPPANNPPIGINDIAITPQDSPVTGNVLVNDTDPEGGPLTVTTTPVTPPTKGTVTLNPDGTFTYTPNPGVTGQDGFCYELKDNAGLKDTACVVINIIPNPKPTNDKPVAIDDNTQTYQNTAVVIPVKFNDTDPDAAGTPNGTLGTPVKLTNPTHGTVTANADGTFTYTPTTGFVGSDSFTYQICDNGTPSLCDTATVTINVLALPPAGNRPPVVVDDAIITSVNTPKSGDVSRNDYDPDAGQTLTFSKQTNPSHGTVVFNADGTYTYTPTTGYVGSDIFTYKVCDSGSPQLCTLGTVIIAVLPPANKVCLQAKVYLQGALFGVLLPDTLMRDDLRVKGYLPTTSPYPAMGMTGLTTANTSTLAVLGASSPSGKDAIVDWVFVELRSKTSPTTVVDSRSALLQRDGDIVDVDGVSTITFNSASPDSYYVVVKHRNHLGVMSKTPVDMTSTCGVIDFRKTTTPTYNLDETNVVNKAQVDVLQGVALWAGNSLFDNQVIYQGTDNDVNVIYQQVINYVGNVFVSKFYTLKGYYTGDINLNGDAIFQGTGNDVEYIYQNIIKNHPGNTLGQKFFIIKEQIP